MLAQENASGSSPGPNPAESRLLRARLGWSTEQLARAAGVATLTVVSFELGTRQPREGTLIALRRAFRNGQQGAASGRGLDHSGDNRIAEVDRPASLNIDRAAS